MSGEGRDCILSHNFTANRHILPNYPDLTSALEDMRGQSGLYRPTVFWEEACTRIAAEISEHGVESFRSLPGPLGFFVPTYGIPGSGLTDQQAQALLGCLRRDFPDAKKSDMALTQFLSGAALALADYRVLLAGDDAEQRPHLHAFSESSFGAPVEQFEFDGRRFSRSSLNYLLGLTLLKRHLEGEVPRTVLEIGGGFGTLGEVLSHSGIDGVRYIDVDIPPTSFVAQEYLSAVLGKERVATYTEMRDAESIEIDGLPHAAVLCPWQIERLQGRVDLFVNFVSFQEMEPHVVRNYLQHVSRLGARWVLLRNLREGKPAWTLARLGVETPILGDDYPDMLQHYRLVERNVLPFGYRTVDNFHSELLLFKRSE